MITLSHYFAEEDVPSASGIWDLFSGEIAHYSQSFQDLNHALYKGGLMIVDLMPRTGFFDEWSHEVVVVAWEGRE